MKGHLNGDMKAQNGSKIRDVKYIGFERLVFEVGDTDNNLMIKQDSSYILCHHINCRTNCYPHSLEFCSLNLDKSVLYTITMLKKLKKKKCVNNHYFYNTKRN